MLLLGLTTITVSLDYNIDFYVYFPYINVGYLLCRLTQLASYLSTQYCSQAGLTPLHIATQHGYISVVEILIASGANVAASDKVRVCNKTIQC